MSLIDELKRRNVFRVAAAYAVVGWVVLEVASIIAPALGLPDWTITLLLFAGVCGFPFALIFAWAFELTPEGLKRTEQVAPTESITPQTGSKLTRVTIVLLSVALVLVLAERFGMFGAMTGEGAAGEAAEQARGPQSIAVLPFVNMSEDKANEHFGDGLSEELLNLLAKVPDLHVAARTSSFYFKDKDATIADVARALNVGTVLEGSVRRSGDTIRVVAQLISAADESHLWSEKYDRPLTDVFKVQDDIARQIVKALMPHLDVEQDLPASSDTGEISPEMFELFLLARQTYYEGTDDAVRRAHADFLTITRAAPAYVPAWPWLARSWLYLPDTPVEQSRAGAQAAIDTALRLDPDNVDAMVGLARLQRSRGEEALALQTVERALARDPRSVDAMLVQQYLLVSLGRPDEAIASLQRARAQDPLHPEVLVGLAHLLNLQGHKQEAFAALDNLYRVNPVRAASMEFHLYSDSQELARLVYFGELDSAGETPSVPPRYFSWVLLEAGLYDHPMLQKSYLRPIVLAATGDRAGAEAALAEELARLKDSPEKQVLQMETWMALEDYRRVSDLLWDSWQALGTGRFSDDFWLRHALYLGVAAKMVGDRERLDAMMPLIAVDLANASPSHWGDYHEGQATFALLQDRDEDALAYLEQMASQGYFGDYEAGGPLAFNMIVPQEPRFAGVTARIEANRDAQLALLARLRASGMSAADMRREYLAR